MECIRDRHGNIVHRSGGYAVIIDYVHRNSPSSIANLSLTTQGEGAKLSIVFKNQDRYETAFSSRDAACRFVSRWKKLHGVAIEIDGVVAGIVASNNPWTRGRPPGGFPKPTKVPRPPKIVTPRPPRVSPETKRNEIMRRWDEGRSIEEAAYEIGITASYAYKLTKGLRTRRRRRTRSTGEKKIRPLSPRAAAIKEGLLAGEKVADIAKSAGVTKAYVYYIAHRYIQEWRPNRPVSRHGHAGGGGTPTYLAYLRFRYSGIAISERWLGLHGFQNFLEDMGEKPKGSRLHIPDRSMPVGPGNCRWKKT